MIVYGKEIARKMEEELSSKFSFLAQHGVQKKVCFVLFRDDAGSRQFIKMKSRVAERLGIIADTVEATVSSTERLFSNLDRSFVQKYDGVVVQLPLPHDVDVQKILNEVPKNLDIDMLSDEAKHAYRNDGATTEYGWSHDPTPAREQWSHDQKAPPVARAVKEILEFYHVDLTDRKVLVIGKGKLVGEPVSVMFLHTRVQMQNTTGVREPFTLHVVDIDTPEHERLELIASADIIVSGIGSPHFLKPNMLKKSVVLIDAGTSEQSGKLVGDIDPACAEVASLLTSVPGGIGPVTVVSLFANLL